ncbi:hypothetical protein O6H91_10G072800 [Diphasiastrum complanatum]|uniref:Uncharacterized protein n=1 Tax=Diphasiastrum complanatum TaxID=34168 RepID=A0ACC2CIB9_DIPCM|nr:hypothetical protein O6H91_10G072800 [Diphasiastrum complanatum]
MVSKSYSNLLELSGDFPSFAQGVRRLPRVKTAPYLCHLENREEESRSSSSEAPSSTTHDERTIIVANILPVNAERRPHNLSWSFSWDEDSLLLRLKDGLPASMEVIYVGCLKVDIETRDQDVVAANLFDNFNCVAAFLNSDLRTKFYHGFCKQQLWPLFHYNLPLTPAHGSRFDRSLWRAYVTANKIFADKIMEVINPDEDYVWIHDYHLMLLPTFLRRRFNRIKLGFFLHSPFPSSEIYRALPVREEILRALLNVDLLGFHTFDYARHFLSCCSRMLGLEYKSKRGYMSLDYYGRSVGIRIMPVGIHMGQLEAGLKLEETKCRARELKAQFEGKIILLGVDDMDAFKGIGLKFLGMEELLNQRPELRGKVVLVQIANPARGRGRAVVDAQREVHSVAKTVNDRFEMEGYEPIVLLERIVPLYERIAFYSIAECCVVTALRDGMNLIPYEYIVCRQGISPPDGTEEAPADSLKKSMLIVSEFIGCSPSLSGAIRVNPWNIEAMADAINTAIVMRESEKAARHEKHYKYVSSHDVAFWARSFMADLERICLEHSQKLCYGIGFGLRFRVVALDPNFRKLLTEHIVFAYKRSMSRIILLDYDGTMMPQGIIDRAPSSEMLSVLNVLCSDPRNVVFIVSGRGREILSEWFAECEMLGIASEHGYFYRWQRDSEWIRSVPLLDFEWKQVVAPIMRQYMESTDGSVIESKESALVWQHCDADPDFASWQTKELQNHLESVLANEAVSVKSGHHQVEVNPQGVSKGTISEKLLASMASRGSPPDFIVCVGDDRSDEDMFERIESIVSAPSQLSLAEVFACTVGQKPSKARYYLDDTHEVMKMLQSLASVTSYSSVDLADQFQSRFTLENLL